MEAYAWVYVEATSPEEAMKIAENNADNLCYMSEIGCQLEDSNLGVNSCESYPTNIEYLDGDQLIITADGKIGQLEDLYEKEELENNI